MAIDTGVQVLGRCQRKRKSLRRHHIVTGSKRTSDSREETAAVRQKLSLNACSKFPPLQIRWNSAGSLREAWRIKRQNISQIGPRGAKLEIFTLWWETWNLKKKFQIDPTALKIAGMPRQGVLMKNFWKGAPTTSSERRSSGKMPLLCRRTGELNARLYVAI